MNRILALGFYKALRKSMDALKTLEEGIEEEKKDVDDKDSKGNNTKRKVVRKSTKQ